MLAATSARQRLGQPVLAVESALRNEFYLDLRAIAAAGAIRDRRRGLMDSPEFRAPKVEALRSERLVGVTAGRCG